MQENYYEEQVIKYQNITKEQSRFIDCSNKKLRKIE